MIVNPFFIISNSSGLEVDGVAVHVTNGVKEKREKPETGLSVRFLVVSPVFAASFVTQSHFYLIALSFLQFAPVIHRPTFNI